MTETIAETRQTRNVPVRRESLLRVLGKAIYSDDVKFEDLLYVGMVRSPYPHAKITSLDISEALAMPEVVAAYTSNDIERDVKPGFHMHPYPSPNSVEWASGAKAIWRYPLAGKKVHFAGEPVAVVVCKHKYAVEDAIESVKVEYDPLPALMSAEESMQAGAPLIYEDLPNNVSYKLEFPSKGEDDDVYKTFTQAYKIIKGRFEIGRQTGIPLETRIVTANYNGDLLTVWEGTQNPNLLRAQISATLNLPESRIRIIIPVTGGSYGIKSFGYDESLLVPYVALKLHRSIRWIEDRVEHFSASGHARQQVHYYEAAVTRDGTIVGLKDKIIVDGGIMNSYWPSWRATAFTLPGPYKIQNLKVELYGVLTNKPPYFPLRGFGKFDASVPMERIIDHVSRELLLDPVEVRRKNFIRKEDLPYESATGALIDSGNYHLALERALDLLGYSDFKIDQRRLREQGRFLGFGLAMCFEPTGASSPGRPGYEPARLQVLPSGDVLLQTGSCDQGQGHETTLAQIVATELGIQANKVTVIENDNFVTPYGFGAFSSRFSNYTVSAAVLAARKAREKILTLAASKLQLNQLDLEIDNGLIKSKTEPVKKIALAEISRIAYFGLDQLPHGVEPGIEVTAYFRRPNERRKSKKQGALNIYLTYPYAVHAGIVEVDPEDGSIRILKYVSLHDSGKELNPTIVRTQQIGSIAMGIGSALYEEIKYGTEGELLTASLMDYHIPTFLEMPNVVFDTMETNSPFTPLGAKGASETGVIGPPAVIAQAVEDALQAFGVRITQIPMTMDRIWARASESVSTANIQSS